MLKEVTIFSSGYFSGGHFSGGFYGLWKLNSNIHVSYIIVTKSYNFILNVNQIFNSFLLSKLLVVYVID